MPPKKRARPGAIANAVVTTPAIAPASTPPAIAAGSGTDLNTREPADNDAQKEVALRNSMWTCDQESALFKCLMRWKPAGVHKHFRMIAISEQLRSRGYDPNVCLHMRIPSIWQKLRSCYNLDTIDERESIDSDDDDDDLPSQFYEFRLPTMEYRDLVVQRAIASEPPSSPPQLDVPSASRASSPGPPSPKRRKTAKTTRAARSNTVDDTEEGTDAASSPGPAAGTKSSRSNSSRALRRSTTTRGRAAAAAAAAAAITKDDSTEAEEEQGHGDENDDGSSDDNKEDEAPEKVATAQAPRTRAKAGAAKARARASTRRTKGRGG